MNITLIEKKNIKAYEKPIIYSCLSLCGGRSPLMVGFFRMLYFLPVLARRSILILIYHVEKILVGQAIYRKVLNEE